MATREEIREGIRNILLERQPAFAQAYGNAQDSNVIIGATVRMLWEYLHSQGVVLKVERALPFDTKRFAGIATALDELKFVAVESLIKEG